mgnify:CR=1 FL=1
MIRLKKETVLIALVSFIVPCGCSSHTRPRDPHVCIKRHCVNVEIAQSDEELQRGLQFRDQLDQEEGMLFIFDSPSVPEPLYLTYKVSNPSSDSIAVSLFTTVAFTPEVSP